MVSTLRYAVARSRFTVEDSTKVIEPAVAGGAAVDTPAVAGRLSVRMLQGWRQTMCRKRTAGA